MYFIFKIAGVLFGRYTYRRTIHILNELELYFNPESSFPLFIIHSNIVLNLD